MRISDAPMWRDVRFVCTDKKTHPSREIVIVSRDEETGELSQTVGGANASGRTVNRPHAVRTEAVDGQKPPAWDLPACPTCHRAPDLSSEGMCALVEGILAENSGRRVTWDMSYLG